MTTPASNAPTNSAHAQNGSGLNFPTLSPPPMKTLVYAPNVRILISRGPTQYDVSKDVVRGQVVRKENSASSLFFTLANKDLRYNNMFHRMDRVEVYLYRVKWVQVFSGYLDTVPFVQVYPGTVDFRATCTLKRLLHCWWNPALPESQRLFDQMGFATTVGGDGQVPTDSGIGQLMRQLLVRVGGWSNSNIHIQDFPMTFLDFMLTNMDINHWQEQGDKFKHMLLGPDISMGAKTMAGYQPTAPLGAWGQGQPFYLQQIVKACDDRSMGPKTSDLSYSQTVAQAGGEGQSDQESSAAWGTIQEYGQNWQTQTRNSDAAILAVACVLVESQFLNLANVQVPESLTFSNDGLGTNLDSVGLFQQRNNGSWGTISQRMNAYSSAGMFYDRLAQFDWRNMDPGAAIYRVQIGASPEAYNAQIPAATELVQGYREGTQPDVSAAGALAPGANTIPGMNPSSASQLTGTPTSSPSNVGSTVPKPGKPNPDSEGAINCATAIMFTPYSHTLGGGDTPGVGLDAAGLVHNAFKAVGINVGRNTGEQASIPRVEPKAMAQRGDIIQVDGGQHTGIYLGLIDGLNMWITTGGPDGTPGSIQPLQCGTPAEAYLVLRACPNGGVDPTAPWTNPVLMPAGNPPGTGQSAGTIGTGARAQDEPIARNLFAYQFFPGMFAADTADMFDGQKAFIDAQPLMQMVQAVATAGMRHFQSAPNGDFIAYYPDFFGLDGKPAVLNLEDIEIKDARVDLSDDPLTTHVYVEGDFTGIGVADQALGWLTTAGVATVENEWLYQRLIKVAPGDMDSTMGAEELMRKFGVRPLKKSFTMVSNPQLEFLLACQIFMGKWASQYETTLAFTFMPELYPGMRINLNKHGLQVYVSEVVHIFDFEAGFTTSATISAPSKPNAMAAMSKVNSFGGKLSPLVNPLLTPIPLTTQQANAAGG